MAYANEVDLTVYNNVSFLQAFDVSQYIGVYPLQSGIIRAQMRQLVTDPEALIEWNSMNGGLTLSISGSVATVTIQSPISVTEECVGAYVYDCRFEYMNSFFATLFGGTLTWVQGVTRVYGDAVVAPFNVPILASVTMTPTLQNALIFG